MFKIIASVVFKTLAADNKSVYYVYNVAVIYIEGALVTYSRDFRVIVSAYFSSSPKIFKKSKIYC